MRLRKSSLITKLIILTVMIYAIVTIVAQQPKIEALNAEAEDYRQQIAAIERENLELEEKIQTQGTDESVIAIARERLNMVFNGEIQFIDSGK